MTQMFQRWNRLNGGVTIGSPKYWLGCMMLPASGLDVCELYSMELII